MVNTSSHDASSCSNSHATSGSANSSLVGDASWHSRLNAASDSENNEFTSICASLKFYVIWIKIVLSVNRNRHKSIRSNIFWLLQVVCYTYRFSRWDTFILSWLQWNYHMALGILKTDSIWFLNISGNTGPSLHIRDAWYQSLAQEVAARCDIIEFNRCPFSPNRTHRNSSTNQELASLHLSYPQKIDFLV